MKALWFLPLVFFLSLGPALGQQLCVPSQGGRYVFAVYYGYNQTQVGTSDRACAVQMARQLRNHGVRFVNPYSRSATYWQGVAFELMDVQDPNGVKGEAKAILAEALPSAVSIP